MKTALWLGLLGVLVFGIGWQSSRLSARDAAPPQDGGREGGSRSDGPPFGSIRDFADDLGLDAGQRERVARIVADSSAAIDAHQVSIRELKAAARRDVLAVLTEAQRGELERRIDETFARHAKERLEADLSWFQRQGTLDAAALARVGAILGDYESGKRTLFRSDCAGGPPEPGPPPEGARAEAERLRERRDQQLAEVVDAATLAEFRARRSHSRGRGGERGPGDEQPSPRHDHPMERDR